MSGHNKWGQIKHKKALTDAKRGKLFSKLVKEITVAARTGAPDPAMNPRLRAAIEHARADGLPKDNIDRAIAKAKGGGESENLKEFLYEAVSADGMTILIEGISDNTNRTFNEIRHLLGEHNGHMADPGSLAWNFEKIGMLHITQEDNAAKSEEDIEMAIIDSGAADFTFDDNAWIVETVFTDREHVRSTLEASGIVIREAGHDYKPKSAVSLREDIHPAVEKLLNALTEHDDIQEVYTNL